MSRWTPPEALRRKARGLLGACHSPGPRLELEELATELQIHQIELELQNEELRSAQAELDAALGRYRSFFDDAPIAHLVLDLLGRIRDANRRATAMLCTERTALIGAPLSRFLAERDADRLQLWRVNSQSCEIELRCRICAGGSPQPPSLIRLARAEHEIRVAMLPDVPDRDELRETFLRFRQIAEHIEDAFYVAETSTGKTLYASPAFERIFGVTPEERPWLTGVHPGDGAHVAESLRRLLAGDPCDEEHRVLRADGSLRLVRHRAFLIEDADRVTGIVTDVTDEREFELELRQAHKMETLGALSSSIAHDFNNLLMGITGCAQMALSRLDPDDPARAHVQRGLDAALRGASITRQLLAFGRKRPVEKRAIDVDGVAHGNRELLASLLGGTIDLVIELGAPGARVLADTGDVEQILMNLATNARDAMPAGGQLSIRTALRVSGETDRCMLALTVSDTGQGMDEQTRARLFEPFFTTKADGRGTGLGMASVAALVARMGGSIDVESRPGGGTTFTLLLPVATIELEPDGPAEPPPRGRGNVLVVEDDALVRMTLGHYLHSLGYRALLASSYEDAMRVARSNERLDALVTDVLLPGRLGRDVAREVTSKHPRLPVLFVSAHPARELIQKGQVPADALLLQKPFDPALLASTLRDLFEQHAIALPPRTVLLVDDSEAARSILRDHLRSKGYRVLAAADARQALALASENAIDALVTDFALRETTGTALAAELRESCPQLPVVLVSGSAEVEVPPGGRFLQKPFELERLDREIEEAISER